VASVEPLMLCDTVNNSSNRLNSAASNCTVNTPFQSRILLDARTLKDTDKWRRSNRTDRSNWDRLLWVRQVTGTIRTSHYPCDTAMHFFDNSVKNEPILIILAHISKDTGFNDYTFVQYACKM